MPDINFTTAEVNGNTVFFNAEDDLSPYDPALLTSWAFEFKPRTLADSLRASDAVYDVLDSQGIVQVPGSGYPIGSFNAALRIANPLVRCTKVTRGEEVNDAPTVAELLALPGDVIERYMTEVDSAGRVTAAEMKALAKKPVVEDNDSMSGVSPTTD